MAGEFKTVRKGHEMTNRKMFFTMLWGAVFRRRSRAVMAVIASMVGAATLFCLAATCIAVPQQMNEEMRAYGANLIVTPSESAEKSHGIDTDTVKALNQMVKGSYSARSAAYRYESVRINSAPYTLAGITTKDVKALNHHWNVTGDWPSKGNVMLGRDVADALGVSIGSTVTIGYRASDDAQDSGALSQTEAQAKENGRVSSDIMENTGTEFRVGGIVDTGGSEDEIVYAVNADVAKLAGSKRGADVIEYSVNAVGSELNDVVEVFFNELLRITQKRAVQVDVFARGKLHIEARTKLDERSNVAINRARPCAGLQYAGNNLQNGGFAGTVRAQNAEHVALLHFEGNIVECTEFLKAQLALQGGNRVFLDAVQLLACHVEDHGHMVHFDHGFLR